MTARKHLGKVFRRLLFNRKRVAVNSVAQPGLDCFLYVVNSVLTFVTVIVAWPSIRQKNDNLAPGFLVEKFLLRVTQRRTDPGVPFGLNRTEPVLRG